MQLDPAVFVKICLIMLENIGTTSKKIEKELDSFYQL